MNLPKQDPKPGEVYASLRFDEPEGDLSIIFRIRDPDQQQDTWCDQIIINPPTHNEQNLGMTWELKAREALYDAILQCHARNQREQARQMVETINAEILPEGTCHA